MERNDINKVLQACMLILDEVPENEIIRMIDKPSLVKAQYIVDFLKSYKY